MQEVVKFFWEPHKRAVNMDAIDKLLGKPTHYTLESLEWTDAYKNTLSNKNSKTFDHEWNKLDDYLEEWANASDKKQKHEKSYGVRMIDSELRESLGLSEDWSYNSWPLISSEYWREFCSVVGIENLTMVSLTAVQTNDQDLIRSSFFINSIGRGNLTLAYPT